ncbi:MAG TPA: hypothetical protein VJ787_00575 [Thermoleophilia bacterium]|nr:hypothetical protein [Thermoleophilia bacterium]
MSQDPGAAYDVAHIDDIADQPQGDTGAQWKPIRHQFGIGSFGVNLFRSTAAGELLTHVHNEEDTGHEELFFVAQGSARFEVAGEAIEAPAGTFVFVRDPGIDRGAWATEAGTTLLVVGGKPGTAYSVSEWELEEFGPRG